jgi:hypothetical protein
MVLHYFANISTMSTFIVGIAFIMLQKLNLLLTHERIEDNHARRNREDEKEARERAKHFNDMGCKDMSLEEKSCMSVRSRSAPRPQTISCSRQI